MDANVRHIIENKHRETKIKKAIQRKLIELNLRKRAHFPKFLDKQGFCPVS